MVQVKALKDAGCAVVFQEIVSTRTAQKDRHQLQAALNALVDGDELVITALSRLGEPNVKRSTVSMTFRRKRSMSEHWMDW